MQRKIEETFLKRIMQPVRYTLKGTKINGERIFIKKPGF